MVTAPIELAAIVYPGEDGLIRVTLVDKNRDLLARQLLRVNVIEQGAVQFSTRLAFEIPNETTSAILTVETQDHFHRTIALRSVELILQSSGEGSIESHSIPDRWLTITQPEPGAIITESPLVVKGAVTPVNGRPIIFELVTERGGAVISKQLAVETPGEAVDFEVPLIFSPVTAALDMRLVIRQSADIIGVDAVLDSLPITLAP